MSSTTIPLTEKAFQQRVVDFARITGWLAYHTWDSRKSEKGYPDLTLVRHPRLVFAELKVEKVRPRVPAAAMQVRPAWLAHRDLDDAQAAWLAAFDAVAVALADSVDPGRYETAGNPSIEVYVWRPSDWSLIQHVLKR